MDSDAFRVGIKCGRAGILPSCFAVLTSMLASAQTGEPRGKNVASRSDARAPVRILVHEAFAQPLEGASTPAPAVPPFGHVRPDVPPHDTPPAVKPSVSTAIWVPGYWAWDQQGDDASGKLVWLPGVWRVPPPGMRWVPGYWSEADDGWRWVRGFWYPRDQPRLRYLPAPPPPQDEPESAAPTDEQFAVPGHWSYAGGRYVWNRGFKARRKEGWEWIPSHHVWTPAGALLLPGYWDYALDRRGLLFAPLPADAARQPGSSAAGSSPLAPNSAVNLDGTPQAWVASAELGHYYFEPRETGASESGAAKSTISLAELARRRDGPRPVAEISADSLPRIAQRAEVTRLLAVQRSKFEATADRPGDEAPRVFYLPPPAEPIETPSPRPSGSPAAGQYVPGVAGRRVPGARQRSLPGMSGRTVPGVDTGIPGVVGPGVLPGTDTRGAMPGAAKP